MVRAFVGTLIAVMLAGCARSPWVTTEVAGPTKVVGVVSYDDAMAHRGPEGFTDLGTSSATMAVVCLRVPSGENVYAADRQATNGTVQAFARVEPDGVWSRLSIRKRQADSATVDISDDYPPGVNLRLKVVSLDGATEAIIGRLPATKEFADLHGPVISKAYIIDKVFVEGVAYRPRMIHPDRFPVVGAVLKADIPPDPNTLWRLKEYGVTMPYGSPAKTKNRTWSIFRCDLTSNRPYLAIEESESFSDKFPRVQIDGILERCELRKEIVDFGLQPQTMKGRTTYVVPLHRIERKLSDGRSLWLCPIAPHDQLPNNDPVAVLNLSWSGESPWPGEDSFEKVGTTQTNAILKEVTPSQTPQLITLCVQSVPKSLRLILRRTRPDLSVPFRLNPKVRDVNFSTKSGSDISKSLELLDADSDRKALFSDN